ncbi:MAG: DUF2232 domain-containing protein [Bacillota bacterium]
MNKKAIDVARAVAAVVLLTFLNIYLPIFSLFVLIVWPIPIMLVTVKHGVKTSAITIAIAALINGIFFSPIMGLLAVIGFGFVGFVIANSINENFSPLKVLIFTIIAVLISQSIILLISGQYLNYNLTNMISESMQMFSSAPQIDDALIEQLMNLIKSIVPSILFISSIIIGTLNYYASLWYLNNKGISKNIYKSIDQWRFPKWPISLGILATLMATQNTILLNINIILFFFAFFQGFSVGLYYVAKKKSFLLNMLYIFLVLIIPIISFAMIFIGLLDMWLDFRKIKTN